MMLLLAPLLLLANQAGARDDDVVIPIAAFEATTAAAGESGWTPIAIDGAPGGTSWERARARFDLPADFEAGDWMLCTGGSGLELAATLNGHPLERIADGCAAEPKLAAGPRFDVSSIALRNGENVVDVAFSGARKGRGFERGPVYLLSRTPAARLRASAAAADLAVGIANFASLATSSRSNHLLDRVAFKFAAEGGEPRLAGQVDCSVIESRKSELPARELATRRTGGGFPTLSLELEDSRLQDFHGRIQASAPTLTSPLRLSDAKAVTFEMSQHRLPDNSEYRWRLRFFPALGGPLRVVYGEDYVLLRNELVGFFAADATVLGGEEAPSGLAIVLRKKHEPGTLRTIVGPSVLCGVVGFEREGADPSQADSMEDLVESIVANERATREASSQLASSIVVEPVAGSVPAGVAARASGVATLAGMRVRGTRFVYAPAAGAQSAEAFFGDTFSMFHFPVHERGAIEWLLSTQDEGGAVRGDLPADASACELAGADAFAVLRACRWFRWTYDGDRFLKMVPGLARALAHADSVELLAAPVAPQGRERLSAAGLALARAVAHRELAAALAQLGEHVEVLTASTAAAERQLEALLRPLEQGGLAVPDGFVEREGEDPRDAALALVYDVGNEARKAAVARRLGSVDPGKTVDWRDALVARALMQSGLVSALRGRLEAVDREARGASLSSAAAGYHGALNFGVLRIRRDDLGTLEISPQFEGRTYLMTSVRIPEGPVRVQIMPANAMGERQVVATNESSLDLMLVLGIPGFRGRGSRTLFGELTYALHEKLLDSGDSWREVIR